MKIAVFGKSGQLSKALKRVLALENHEVHFFARSDCDLAAEAHLIEGFASRMNSVDVVILAAAYTNVDGAESNKDLAFKVNEHAPRIIARICKNRDIPVIYISSDYVFDGNEKNPYLTDHTTRPLNVYGLSKRAGELAIVNSGCDAAILRTSWLYGESGHNFLTTMLQLKMDNQSPKVVDDQMGRPTYVGHLAQAILVVAAKLILGESKYQGVFHVTNTGKVISWADFAQAIFTKTQTESELPITVEKTLSQELPGLARRPLYSALNTETFEKVFGFSMPDWEDGLDFALREWRIKKKLESQK